MTNFDLAFEKWDADFQQYLDHLKERHKRTYLRTVYYRVRVFWRWLKERRLLPHRLKSRHFVAYVKDLKVGKLCHRGDAFSPRTIVYLKREALKWTRYLYKSGRLLLDPFSEFTAGDLPKRYGKRVLTVQQIRQILDSVDTSKPLGLRNRAIFEVAYGSGLRAGELASLNLASLDFGSRVLELRDTKNRWERQVPMTRSAVEALQKYLRDGRPYLVTKHTKLALWVGRLGKGLDTPGIIVLPRLHRQEVGVYFTMHDFRRSFATHLVDGGAPAPMVSELLGHRALDSSQHYAQVLLRELQKVHDQTHPRA